MRRTEVLLITCILIIAVFEGRFLILSSLGRHAEAQGNRDQALLYYEKSKGEWFSRDLHLSRAHLYIHAERVRDAQEALDDYFAQNAEDPRAVRLLGDLKYAQGHYEEAQDAYERAYRVNKWNDLGIVRGLIATHIAQGKSEELSERLNEIHTLLSRYEDAIESNAHFITLSTTVEEFLTITKILAVQFPDDAPIYHVMGARVDRHAQLERQKIAARRPGFLW